MAEQNHQVPDAQDAQNEQKAPQEKPRYIKIHRVIIGVKPGYILRKIGEPTWLCPPGRA